MPAGDSGVVQVAARLLDAVGAVVPEGLGMASDGAGVAGDHEVRGSGAAHSAHLLMEVFPGPRKAAVDAVVRVRRVDSDLQGRRDDHGAEGARPDPVLNPAAFLGQRTGPVGDRVIGWRAMLAMPSAPRRESWKGIAGARTSCR